MSTPTATPRTDAALLSSDCACNCGHTFKLLIEEKYDEGKCVCTGPDIANGNDSVVVLADFARTLETELTAAKAERDLAITRVASILRSGTIDEHICGDVRKWVEDWSAELGDAKQEAAHYMSEAGRLRAEVEKWQSVAATMSSEREHNANEASRLRAELERADVLYQRACEVEHALRAEVKDKARLDWLEKNWIHWPIVAVVGGAIVRGIEAQNEETIRAAIDAAMKGTT